MTITYFKEDAGSPRMTLRPFNSTAVRSGIIPGDRFSDFLQDMFPVGLPTKTFSADLPWLFCSGFVAVPVGGDRAKIISPDSSTLDFDQLNQYEALHVTIEFSSTQSSNGSPEGQGEDPVELLEHRWSTGGEFITVPAGGVQWHPTEGEETGNVDEVTPVDFGLMIPTFEMQLRWPRVRNPPFSVIRDRVGTVNNATLTFNTGVVAPETLLFLGAELQRTILTTGALAWDVTYRFSERRVPLAVELDNDPNVFDTLGGVEGATRITVGGWNHFFRCELDAATHNAANPDNEIDGKTGFYRLKFKADGRVGASSPLYRLKSHAELFQEGP